MKRTGSAKNSSVRRLLFGSSLLCLWSCGAVQLAENNRWQAGLSGLAQASEGALPGDPACYEGVLRSGSRLSYSITRQHPDGSEDRWRLTLIAPAPGAQPEGVLRAQLEGDVGQSKGDIKAVSDIYSGAIEMARGEGEVEQSSALFALAMLSAGLVDFTRLVQGGETLDAYSASELRRLGSGFGAVLSLSLILNQSKTARSLAFDLVQFPSWWRWLNPSFDAKLNVDLTNAEPSGRAGDAEWVIPVELWIKGDPGFVAKLVAVQPRGVLCMTAGVISLEGFAPDRPDQIVRVELLGAEFGEAGVPGTPILPILRWE